MPFDEHDRLEERRRQNRENQRACRARKKLKAAKIQDYVRESASALKAEANKWYLKCKQLQRLSILQAPVRQELESNGYHLFDLELKDQELETLRSAVYEGGDNFIGQGMVSSYFVDLQLT